MTTWKQRHPIPWILITIVLLSFQSAKSQESLEAKSRSRESLAEIATRIRPDFLLGAHVSPAFIRANVENEKPRTIISSEYNLVSAGIYSGRTWKRSRSTWDFTAVDPVVQFAGKHDLQVYLHPLFGSDQYLPSWLREGEFSDEDLLEIIEERVRIVLTRYRGRIHLIDVYNEGLSRENGKWREDENLFLRLGWHENEYGRWPIFLEKILIWCREYGGDDLKLIDNDNHNTLADMPQALKTWGVSDASCWKPLAKNGGNRNYEPCPLVFDHDFNPKPAYRAMKQLLVEKLPKK